MMMTPTQHKILHSLAVLGIFIVIIDPHSVFESLFELFHLLFEGIESTLDTIIELLFETGSHKTQIIVFYIMFSIAAYACYRLWQSLPYFWQRIRDYINNVYLDYKTTLTIYWLELSALGKIKLVIIGLAMSYMMSLLLF